MQFPFQEYLRSLSAPFGLKDQYPFRVFLTAHEFKKEHILSALEKTKTCGTVVIGTSCLYSLDLFSIQRQGGNLKHLIIIDISEHVNLFWKNFEAIILGAKNRIECLESITQDVKRNCKNYFPKCTSEDVAHDNILLLKLDIFQNVSFLSSDDRFKTIQNLFIEKRFAFVQGTFFGSNYIETISEYLLHRDWKIDILYLSNLHEYAESADFLELYRKAISDFKLVMSDDTNIIDTEPKVNGLENKSLLEQRISNKFISRPITDIIPCSPSANSLVVSIKAQNDFLSQIKSIYPKGMPQTRYAQIAWAVITLRLARFCGIINLEDYTSIS